MVTVILCSGLRRSASTWSYNVCCDLAERAHADRPGSVLRGGYRMDSDKFLRGLERRFASASGDGIEVIKAHEPGRLTLRLVREGRIRNVYTLRDPRDAFASMERFLPRRPDQSLDWRIANFQRFLALGSGFLADGHSHVVRYEDMVGDPVGHIRAIAAYLDLPCDAATAAAVDAATGLQRGAGIVDGLAGMAVERKLAFDPHSLLHAGHFDGGTVGRWRQALDPDLQRRLNRAFLPWLLDFGYADDQLARSLFSGPD